jgi:trimeric autotransporter adhesin
MVGVNMAAHAQTYSVPGVYSYTVAAGVSGIYVNVKGGSGGKNSDEAGTTDSPGHGACVQAYLAVSAGQVLTFTVGGGGGAGSALAGGTGGYNGGGAGGYYAAFGGFGGGGGGGASTVATGGNLVVVAGGGGGAGLNVGSGAEAGGDGGGTGLGNSAGVSGSGTTGIVGGGDGTGGAGGGIGGAGGFCTVGCTGLTAGSAGGNGSVSGIGAGGAGGPDNSSGGGGAGYGAGGGGEFSGGGGGGDFVNGTYLGFGTAGADEGGCNMSPNGSITVTVSCSITAITGPDSVCSGSNVLLHNSASGGTWSSSDGTIASIGSTGVVNGASSSFAVATITYTLGPGCMTTYPMTVNPLPPAITGTLNVCTGDTRTLSDAVSGTWSSAAVLTASVDATSGVVTGVNTGTATIIFTSAIGACHTSAVMTVNPYPAAITGFDSVCQTTSLTLNDATAGGTWSSSGGPGAVTLSGATPVTVTGTTAGTVTISYTVTYASGICASTVLFTVDPAPSVIGGPSKICYGDDTEKETNTLSGGTWSIAPVTTATIDPVSGVVTPISPTLATATVTYTSISGCFVTRVITINPLPSPISGVSVICEGSSTTLTDPTGGGTWSSSNTAVSTVTGATVTGVIVAGGTDTIVYKLTTTGCAVIFPMTVNPRPSAIVSPNGGSFCVGSTYTETSTIPTGQTGVWSTAPVATGTIDPTTGIYDALTVGTATVTVTATPSGCFRAATVTVNPVPVITGGDSVCAMGQVLTTLTVNISGGTWSSSNNSVGMVGSTGLFTAVVTGGSTTGPFTITYQLPTGCLATLTMTNNALPSPISGADVICQLDSTLLTDPTTPGAWTITGAGATINGATGMVLGTGAGTPTVTYTITNTGCYSTFPMTVNPAPGAWGVTSMCINVASVTLSSTGGGTWTSSNSSVAGIGSTTGIVTPGGTTGVTTITNTIGATGCFRTETFTVNALPPAITPDPVSVCTGQSVTLHDGAGTSTWSSQDNTKASVGATTGTVLGVAAPGTNITYTDPSTSCYVTIFVTVNTSPPAITASPGFVVCEGLTTTLNVLGGTGNWTSTAGSLSPTSGATSVLSTSSVTGGVTVTYTAPNGCTATAVVTVNAFASISGPSTVCQGSTATYSVTGFLGGGTWTSSVTTVATITAGGGLLTASSPGTTTITFTEATGGCQTSEVVTVNPIAPNTVVALGPTTICPTGFVELTASTGAGLTYQWYNSGGPIAGATNSTYTATLASSYTVHVTNGLCPNVSAATVVTISAISSSITSSPAAVAGTVNACASTGVTLTATGVGGPVFQWQEGSTAIAGATTAIFTPTVNGTYSAVATNTAGCTATSNDITVNLASSPAGVVSVSGALSFCAGGSVTLTSDTGVGYTYQWYDGSGPIVGATDTSFAATASGTYYVIDQNSTGCSTTSASTVVTENPLPTAVIIAATSSIFCQGGSVVLNVPSVAGESYQWYRGGTAITGANSSSYTATLSGNYTVGLTLAGCNNMTASEPVVDVTTPAILPLTSSSFCWGGSSTLSVGLVSGSGPATYQWDMGGTAIAGATNATYTARTPGIYTASVTVVLAGCEINSDTATVTEFPLPNPHITQSGSYLSTENYFVTYTWSSSTSVLPSTVDSTLIPAPGTYYLVVIDTNGCQSAAASITVTRLPNEGVVALAGKDINVFPNPAQTTIQIVSPIMVRAVVGSMDGKTLIDQPNATSVDISKLADGVYTLMLYDAAGNKVKADKLVKTTN